MIYLVKRIDEDVNYGCEERPEGMPVMAVVTLQDSQGCEITVRTEDQILYDREINEGDRVYLDEENRPAKPFGKNWPQQCTTQTIDTEAFVTLMEKVKAGHKVKWKCPFCGGDVGLIEQDERKALIGCDSCDMRITLENN